DLASPARPERIVLVLGEHQVVGSKAGAYERELAGFRIVHRQMPRRALEGVELCGRMTRALSTEVGILERPDRLSEPRPAAMIDHRVVDVSAAIPDRLLVPVHGGGEA